APSAKGDDKFITTDYLQQCHTEMMNFFAPCLVTIMTSSFFNLCNYVQLYAIKSFYTILYEIICNYKLLNGFHSF
ncbi:hypothetical protein, partial [Acinetobacter baumannii]|uniref:hypothetical protein n=1 Tax=Acinetobacter baumannii TaxID=470 RepID=UPI001BB2DAED